MVLDESGHLLLVRKIRKEVLTHALGVSVLHPVIEFLVVAEIKALLLQFPLKVPVGFGDEPELSVLSLDRGYHRPPVIVTWFFSCTSPPGTLKDIVQQEHCHVAPDAITLFGDLRDRLNHCLPEPRLESVQLEHIRPSLKVRLTSAGEDAPDKRDECCRVTLVVLFLSPDEIFRVFEDPGVVRRNMVLDEIEDEIDAAC